MTVRMFEGRASPARRLPEEPSIATLVAVARARVAHLHALAEARSRVEDRYLGGAEMLFPATRRLWDEQVARSEHFADLVRLLRPFDHGASSATTDTEATGTQIDALVASLVEPAQIKALDEMGDFEAAAWRALRWLQPKLVVP
jgi:hypothetical protein